MNMGHGQELFQKFRKLSAFSFGNRTKVLWGLIFSVVIFLTNFHMIYCWYKHVCEETNSTTVWGLIFNRKFRTNAWVSCSYGELGFLSRFPAYLNSLRFVLCPQELPQCIWPLFWVAFCCFPQGYLEKQQSHGLKTWQKRYFRLVAGKLSYQRVCSAHCFLISWKDIK